MRSVLTCATSMHDLNLDVFDENDLMEIIIKVMVVVGLYFGFRGSREHVMIERRNIEKGFFLAGHPLAGKDYWGIKNMANNSNTLSSTETVLKKNKRGRIPVDSKPGHCIERFLLKLPPG